MGTWGTGVIQDDLAADVVGEFFDLYNDDKDLSEIRSKLESSHKDILNDPDEGHLFWLALAKAQWDVGALDNDVFEKIEKIVNSGIDSKAWKNLGGTANDVAKREISIKNFLEKIKTPRENIKKRKKTRSVDAIFEVGSTLVFKMSNGNFGAAIVVTAERQTRYGLNGIVTLRINQKKMPTINEVCSSEVMLRNMGSYKEKNRIESCFRYRMGFKKDKDLFQPIGTLLVKQIDASKINFYSVSWSHIITAAEAQFNYELANPRARDKITLRKYLGYQPWQKIEIS